MQWRDARTELWIHWVLYAILATITALPAGVERLSRRGYHSPQLPPGPLHRYRIQLSALDTQLDPAAGATAAAAVREAMANHVLEQAELTGLYQHHSSR